MNRLHVLRLTPNGAVLGRDDFEVLLPRKYVPADLEVGDVIEVFVYRDSEDRPIATTETPLAQAGEFVCLEVKDVNRMGAFLDWGLEKDLLLPFAKQAYPIRKPGRRVVVHVSCDPVSGRMVAATKFNRQLQDPPGDLRAGQPVELLLYEKTDLGFNAVVDQSFKGLLYCEASDVEVTIGESLTGYVQRIRDDGRVDLSLRASGTRAAQLARDVLLEALEAQGGTLDLGDKSDPEEIRARLDLSKKAFKKAVGALYREGRVSITPESVSLIDPSREESSEESP